MKSIFKKFVVAILTLEASMLLKKHKPTIIAITGSVGKTSTKDAIYAAIKNSTLARKSEKSFNSDIGVPLTVLGLSNGWNNPFAWIKNIIDGFIMVLFQKHYPTVLVLETGIDRPGDMERLTKWLAPDIVVLTRLPSVPVHVEYFSSPEEVTAEKLKLVGALKPTGVLVFNNDDVIIQRHLGEVRNKMVGFSRYLPSDFTVSNDSIVYVDNHPVGVEFTINNRDSHYSVRIKDVVGAQQVYACSAAMAVASVLGVAPEAAVDGLMNLNSPPGRMRLITGLKSSVIIDDTYNSSPTAAEVALETLKEIKFAKRKIAVLGDMLELGKYSSNEHEQIGAQVATCADMLIAVGVRARKIALGALAAGMPESNILQYDDAGRAGKELQVILQSGDVVLVKASQGIRAEQIVEEVMADPESAPQLLVRQDRAWKK